MLLTIQNKPRTGQQAAHSSVVTSVVFSPDGLTLASGSWDGTIKLWDVRNGRLKLKRTLRGDWDEVEAIAYTPDGRAIAGLGTGFDGALFGAVTLWAGGEAPGRELIRASGKLDAIAFSRDGRTLATASGDSRTVMLWDVATGRKLASLEGHQDPIWSIAFSPDGRTLAAASGRVPAMSESSEVEPMGEIRIWDLTRQQPATLTEFFGHKHGIVAIAYSPDGTTLVSGGFDRTARLWDVRSGSERATLQGHEGWVAAVAFSPDGSLVATGSHDHAIMLWDATNGNQLASLHGHTGNVYTVAFSPEGKLLASGSLDGTVRLWELSRLMGQEAVA